jgi:hypothetical protein
MTTFSNRAAAESEINQPVFRPFNLVPTDPVSIVPEFGCRHMSRADFNFG